MTPPRRRLRGAAAHAGGLCAEQAACVALEGDGWEILGRRLRTACGEVDIVARDAGTLAFVEVKSRASLAEAAHALTMRQQQRLLAAASVLLAEHPDWARDDIRFDVMLVDSVGRVRRVRDAIREQGTQLPSGNP